MGQGRNANGDGRRYPCDIHWYASAEMVEYMNRLIDRMPGKPTIAEAHRRMWFRRGWRDKLEAMRKTDSLEAQL